MERFTQPGNGFARGADDLRDFLVSKCEVGADVAVPGVMSGAPIQDEASQFLGSRVGEADSRGSLSVSERVAKTSPRSLPRLALFQRPLRDVSVWRNQMNCNGTRTERRDERSVGRFVQPFSRTSPLILQRDAAIQQLLSSLNTVSFFFSAPLR